LDTLGRLEIGDVIRAKVLEMTSGELMLKLFDGSVFKAEARTEISAKPGDMVDFKVASREEGKVFLEVAHNSGKTSPSLQNDLKKALAELNLDTGSKNISLAEEFKASGVKMTADLFEKALKLADTIPGITSEKAVFMASKTIQPEAATNTLFELLEGKLKLGDQLSQLKLLLDGTLSDSNFTQNPINVKQTEASNFATITNFPAKAEINEMTDENSKS
jgi:galactitol-specific phosphotransferase system IIB component